VAESIMPPYRYLFREVKSDSQGAVNALPVAANRPGHVVIPTMEAIELVRYLQSLDRTSPLPEAGAVKSAAAPEKK